MIEDGVAKPNFDLRGFQVNVVDGRIASSAATSTQAIAPCYGFYDASNMLIASVEPAASNSIAGTTTAKVWIESSQPMGYVKRHFEITPASNAATASGRVTLYATQAEFDAFNAVSAADLPTGPSDAAGKANLRISKIPGTSSNGSGLPNTYTGAAESIHPNDADIVFDATLDRWEISFPVTGFSGFFITSVSQPPPPLPVTLTHFSARADGTRNLIEWAAAAEIDLAAYTVERATDTDATHFASVTSVVPRGTISGVEAIYSAFDAFPARISYYRLRTVDLDGSVDYSDVVAVSRSGGPRGGAIKLYPNPARGQASVQLDLNAFQDDDLDISITDAAGRLVSSTRCAAGATHELSLAGLATGMYTVSAITPAGVSTERLVIE